MQKTTVGSIEITALVDLVQAYPAATVYPELGDGARFSGYLDAEGKVALGFASYLVRDGATLLLVDTGWGPEHDGKLLVELAEAGVKPAQGTHVLFTHLHGDHTGWNIDRQSGLPIFANARHLVPQADWEHYAREAEEARKKATGNRPWLGSFDRDVQPLEGFGLESMFDWDRKLAVRTRKATIERLIADRALVAASHLPAPGLGRFVRAGGKQRWERI